MAASRSLFARARPSRPGGAIGTRLFFCRAFQGGGQNQSPVKSTFRAGPRGGAVAIALCSPARPGPIAPSRGRGRRSFLLRSLPQGTTLSAPVDARPAPALRKNKWDSCATFSVDDSPSGAGNPPAPPSFPRRGLLHPARLMPSRGIPILGLRRTQNCAAQCRKFGYT